jgi:L-alanine-DL-glutamate epimerase-like enolase superfamily enzyme
MRIEHIEAIPLERRLTRTFKGGTYTIDSRFTLVTEVRCEGGAVAQVFGGDEERYQKDVARLINGPFRDIVVGRNLFEIDTLWYEMFDAADLGLVNRGIHTLDLANHSIRMQAIAAVDIALWDALGKALDRPVHHLLGAGRDRVPVIAIGGYYEAGTGDDEFADELRGYQDAGLAGIKMKVGRLRPREDAERVRFARETVGPEFVIACDANQGWTADEAIAFCRAVDGLQVRWFEEPVVWYDQLHGLPRVRRMGGLPIVAGQGEISRFGCRDLMSAEAVDILNVDATIAGGITEWRRIAGMASMWNVSMAHHEEPQVAAHLLASAHDGLYVEIFPNPERDPLWVELPESRPLIRDGYYYLPSGPGLGMPLRADVIARYRVDVEPVAAR